MLGGDVVDSEVSFLKFFFQCFWIFESGELIRLLWLANHVWVAAPLARTGLTKC